MNVLVGSAEAGAGYDLAVDDPGAAAATRYGMAKGGYAVIRPDGYVGYLGGSGDATALEAYLDTYARGRG